MQYARVEEYRYALEAARGSQSGAPGSTGTRARSHRTPPHPRPLAGGSAPGPVRPEEAAELNYLAHGACCAGLTHEGTELVGLLGERVAKVPWVYTGDPVQQIARWRGQRGK